MRAWQIKIEIYEEGWVVPIVVHLFHGRDAAHAERIHQAHRKADAFLRACEDTGVFAGTVPCRHVVTEGWVTIR